VFLGVQSSEFEPSLSVFLVFFLFSWEGGGRSGARDSRIINRLMSFMRFGEI